MLRRLLAGTCVLYIAVVICWQLVLPPFEGPDELHHYDYARYVAVTGHLPDRVPSVINEGGYYTGLWVHEGLYYWLYGHALRLMHAAGGPIDVPVNPRAISSGGPEVPLQVHATPMTPELTRGVVVGRLANALFGLGTVVCVFLALAHATRRPEIAALGTGCLVLVPEFGVRHAFISNDPLSTTFASLGAMLALRWSPGSGASWRAALAGAAAGCAVATKLTAGVIILMMPLAFWMAWRAARTSAGSGRRDGGDEGKSVDRRGLASARLADLAGPAVAWMAGVAAFGAWPFVRNWIVFGDPLALRLKQTIVAQLGSKAMFDLADPQAYVEVVRLLFRSFWVTVGWAGFRPAVPWIWWLYGIWTVVCAAAFVLAVVQIARRRLARGAVSESTEALPSTSSVAVPAIATRVTTIATAIVVLNLVAFVLSVSRFPGYSARYLLPVVVPAMVVVATGLRGCAARLRPRVGDAAIAWTLWAGVLALGLAWLVTFREVVLVYHFGWTS